MCLFCRLLKHWEISLHEPEGGSLTNDGAGPDRVDTRRFWGCPLGSQLRITDLFPRPPADCLAPAVPLPWWEQNSDAGNQSGVVK